MIQTYTRRPQTVEAIQWDGKQESFDFLKPRITDLVPYYVNAVKFTTDTTYVCIVGDYIILSPITKVMTKEEFEQNYE